MPGVHGSGCGCKHETELTGAEFLLPFVDKDSVSGYNEQVFGSARGVFKAYANRLDESTFCNSQEGDPELIIKVPFISPCKITSFHLIGGDNGTYPKSVKLYVNREDVDFTSAGEIEETQTVELVEDFHGVIEYPLKVTKFQNVSLLTMYFSSDADDMTLFYIGLRGFGSNYQRKAVVTVYEAKPNVANHKNPIEDAPAFGL